MSSASLLKIVIIGDGGVGKSAITIQLTQNHFVAEYDPTIENSYRKQIDVDGVAYLLDILDTAGQEELSSLRDGNIRAGRGFIIVYSVQTKSSFVEVDKLINQILRIKDVDQYPMVLCANKCDLPDTLREVSPEDGRQKAASYSCPYFETSAKERINIEEAFEESVRCILRSEGLNAAGGKSTSKKKHDRCHIL
eukprot:TRINITY_DN6472_c1_g1_i2.p1 TRINITY_DN6472_c1_g1~~TRINITY_DN6472_c1_g1_i2.p1  ORF type:complete len:210 (+),score=37.74 TRINITY_DN6472_c1_g1_i2:51-632(+)